MLSGAIVVFTVTLSVLGIVSLFCCMLYVSIIII